MIPISLSTSPGTFSPARESLEKRDFQRAFDDLLTLMLTSSDVIPCCELFFEIVPYIQPNDFGRLENNLQHLLDKTSSLPEYQKNIALCLAKTYLSNDKTIEAMHCFAKALQIDPSVESYREASQVFVKIFQMEADSRLERFLINSRSSVESIASSLKEIATLKELGMSEEDLKPFYQKVQTRISEVDFELQQPYIPYAQKVLQERVAPSEPEMLALQKYQESLRALREIFSNDLPSRELQKEIFEKFKTFFNVLITHGFALIGPPPCHYDIRAMGSIGREEMCPYSDLELMVLIEDEIYLPYFTRLIQILEIQIVSLGETQRKFPFFTCLSEPNRSGLHLDNSPLQECRLMQTPLKMAELQKRKDYEPNDIECTSLKTTSLKQSTLRLYEDYQAHLEKKFSQDPVYSDTRR
jgi:tetratricopeptide (TPR) repeat protein